MERIDLADITAVNERLGGWAAPGEDIRPIIIERLVIADDALDALADVVRRMAGGGRVLLVCDRTPMRRGSDDLKHLVVDRLARVVSLDVRRLPDGPGELHPSREAAQQLAAGLASYAVVVSVGSGSLTDVAKYARHLAIERNPAADVKFVCFPTAASVTAYTSALAVLTVSGVKRTLASRPPSAVVCDLRTLADAPPIMTQAGFGDVIARSVAYGDYYLANEIGMDDGFSTVPGRLLTWAEQDMIERAEDVAASRLPGVRSVAEAILLAGMAMSVVNQTAPISGWEHVMSHFLDMTAAFDAREQALHGGQVGAATLVSARGYERAWANLDLERLCSDTGGDNLDGERQRLESMFRRYDPSGAMTAEIWRDYERKLTRWARAADARRRFAAQKRAGEYEEFLGRNVRPSEAIATALARAGAPRRFRDLDRPIPAASAHAAVQFSHLIRARFTLGDLLDRSGWLNARAAESILAEA
ncbi:MAG: iron-containing alcohol dehydrogenase [Planctomycetes bacterium]|nr:iron-containing alcohol dehydrogenase [Planctomycetota bacterium]